MTLAWLTIDDAPSDFFLEKLAILDRQSISAIWFCRGDALALRRNVAITALQRGIVLANHSWDHPFFSSLSLSECLEQIRRTDALLDALYAEAGVKRFARYFRFPFGDTGLPEDRAAIQCALGELGYTAPVIAGSASWQSLYAADDRHWSWTFDAREWSLWQEPPLQELDSIAAVMERVGSTAAERHWQQRDCRSEGSAMEVVLLHDHQQTQEYFSCLLDCLQQAGLRFISAA